MSYNTGVPQGTDSPGIFPGQGQTNFGRLKAIVTADHKFNDSAATDDGYHKVVRLVNQVADPAAGNYPQFWAINTTYKRSGSDVTAPHFWYRPTSATDTNTFPVTVAPIRAFVNFDGGPATPVIRSSFNVTQVNKTSTGIYEIVFTVAMPSTGYGVWATGKRDSIGSGFVVGGIRDVAYSTAVQLDRVFITFSQDGTSSGKDVSMGNVLIIGG